MDKEYKNIKVSVECHTHLIESIDTKTVKIGGFTEEAIKEKIEREKEIKSSKCGPEKIN